MEKKNPKNNPHDIDPQTRNCKPLFLPILYFAKRTISCLSNMALLGCNLWALGRGCHMPSDFHLFTCTHCLLPLHSLLDKSQYSSLLTAHIFMANSIESLQRHHMVLHLKRFILMDCSFQSPANLVHMIPILGVCSTKQAPHDFFII